ncbi:MAG: NYN domain-containing protein [Planctomycetes bacterium]|nr:NYN domain-containing protein [Planctomycetota bacterium]
MSMTYPAQRVGILVDVQNMFYSAYDCFRGRLNYKRLLDTAMGNRQVVRAIAYAMRDGNNQASFFTMLREVGFELRTKEPRVRPDGTRKGGWDIGIAVEALMLAPKLDVLVLVSGDGDFVELVLALRALGIKVEVYAFERSVGRELREAADLFVPIGEEMIFRDGRFEGEEAAPAVEVPPPPPIRRPAPARVSSFGAGILDEGQDA